MSSQNKSSKSSDAKYQAPKTKGQSVEVKAVRKCLFVGEHWDGPFRSRTFTVPNKRPEQPPHTVTEVIRADAIVPGAGLFDGVNSLL